LSPLSSHSARRAACLLLVLLAVGRAAPAAARESTDATTHHSFGDVEHWKQVFDDPKRDAWQKPDALVAALALGPGMAVADVGAGTGYLSRRLSAAVGPTGTVFSVEVEPALVVHLRERAEAEGTANVTPVLASRDDPRLPAAGVDVVLVLDTYHHLDDRPAYVRRVARALRPGGRVIVVDWQKRKLPVGPPPDHKLPRAQVVDEMTAAGYTLAAAPDVLPYQYVLVFRPAA
jgi:ubiquinone/menaquinone biosynthesis C-methylase UbiE